MFQKLCVGLLALSFVGGVTFADDAKKAKAEKKKADKKPGKKKGKFAAGKVVKVDAEKQTVTVAVRMRKSKESKETTYELKGVEVKKGRKQAGSFSDIKAGARIRLALNEDGTVKAAFILPERKKKPKKDAAS